MRVKRMDLGGRSGKRPAIPAPTLSSEKLFCAYNGCACKLELCPFYVASRNACLKAEAEIAGLQTKYGLSTASDQECVDALRLGRSKLGLDERKAWASDHPDEFFSELKTLLKERLKVDEKSLNVVRLCFSDPDTVFCSNTVWDLDNVVYCTTKQETVSQAECKNCTYRFEEYRLCLGAIRRELKEYQTSEEYVELLRERHNDLRGKWMCADCGKLFTYKEIYCDRCYSGAIVTAFDALLVRDSGGYYVGEPFGEEESYFTFERSANAVAHLGKNDLDCVVGVTSDGELGMNFIAPDGHRWCEGLSSHTLFVQVPKSCGYNSKDLALYFEQKAGEMRGFISGHYVYGDNFILLESWLSERCIMVIAELITVTQENGVIKVVDTVEKEPLNVAVILETQRGNRGGIASKVFYQE